MINWDRVAELLDDFGEEDFEEIVTLFVEEVDACFAEMQNQSGSFAERLHFLKGSAANLGFQALHTQCQALETNIDTSQTPELLALYEASKSAFFAGLAQQKAS